MAYRTPDDPYAAPTQPPGSRVPKPGDPDYIAPDPNAPPPATPVAPGQPGYVPPTGSTYDPNPGGNEGYGLYTPTPAAPIPPAPVVPPTSESRRPPMPTAPPTAGATGTYVWQEGTPTWDPVNKRYTFPQGTWAWQGTGGTTTTPTTPTATPTTPTTATTGPDAIITRALQQAYGRAPTQTDLDYWRGKWQEWGSQDPAYFESRLLGMGAGGADAARYGQYSASQGYRAPENGTNFSRVAELSGLGAPVTAPGAAPAASGGPQGSDPFASMGGGTWVPGVGWYPTANLTDEMKAIVAAGAPGAAQPTATGTGNSQAQIDDARRTALLKMLTSEPDTAESLNASPEASAYRLQAQRSYERDRGQLAESSAFQGTDSSGAFETDLAGLRQSRAEGEAGFVGQLAISRMQNHREDLQFAIQQAQNQGQFEAAQAMQKQLADLDAAIRREQLAQSASQFGQSLGLSYAQLAENARTANNQLGFNYANLLSNQNRDVTLAGLGGG